MPEATQLGLGDELGAELNPEDYNALLTGSVPHYVAMAVSAATMCNIVLEDVNGRLLHGPYYFIGMGGAAASLVYYALELQHYVTYLEHVVQEHDVTRAITGFAEVGQNTTRENDNATNS